MEGQQISMERHRVSDCRCTHSCPFISVGREGQRGQDGEGGAPEEADGKGPGEVGGEGGTEGAADGEGPLLPAPHASADRAST